VSIGVKEKPSAWEDVFIPKNSSGDLIEQLCALS